MPIKKVFKRYCLFCCVPTLPKGFQTVACPTFQKSPCINPILWNSPTREQSNAYTILLLTLRYKLPGVSALTITFHYFWLCKMDETLVQDRACQNTQVARKCHLLKLIKINGLSIRPSSGCSQTLWWLNLNGIFFT